MIVDVGDYILHRLIDGVFKVVMTRDYDLSKDDDQYFTLKGIENNQRFESQTKFIKKIITKEKNPEYFL